MGWKTFFIYKNQALNWGKSLKFFLTSSSYKSFEPMPLPIWNRLSHAREYNINHVRIPQPISSYVVRGDKHRINLRTHDIRVKQRSYTHDTLKSRFDSKLLSRCLSFIFHFNQTWNLSLGTKSSPCIFVSLMCFCKL